VAETIFRIRADGSLEAVEESRVSSEEDLQRLLASYPDVLGGNQISPSAPRRWLLISREMSVPDSVGSGGRWSVDHLFLDQDGIPTLVEVKRSTNTQLRREVVGQILDYAANASAHWSTSTIRATFEGACAGRGNDPEAMLLDRLGVGPDQADDYWQKVDTNLRAGRLRLIFLADQIPVELRRIIEFLNAQMQPAEVLGLELKQFGADPGAVLVPKIVGRTAEAERAKSQGPRPTRQWDEGSFFEALAEGRAAREVDAAKKLFGWGRARYPQIKWGQGAQIGSCFPMFGPTIFDSSLFGIWTEGYVTVMFSAMAAQSPFDNEDLRSDLLARLNQALQTQIPADPPPKQPTIRLAELVDAERLDAVLESFDWAFDQIRSDADADADADADSDSD
jgi:hypothetical protein